MSLNTVVESTVYFFRMYLSPPPFFLSEFRGAAHCSTPNLSLCSAHVGYCTGLFSSNVSFSLYTILLWNKLHAVAGCFVSKYLSSALAASYVIQT
jgi:hypothetical protein